MLFGKRGKSGLVRISTLQIFFSKFQVPGNLVIPIYCKCVLMFLQMWVQVALNLDLAGVESFVKERLGKEVGLISHFHNRCNMCP